MSPLPQSPLAFSLVTLFLAYHWGKPERPEVSGPRRVRRRDKGGLEAVWGCGERISPAWRCGGAASSGEGPPPPPRLPNPGVGPEGRQGGGVARRPDGRRREPRREGWRDRGGGGESRLGGRGRGWGGEGGSPVPLPQPGPGPLADSAPRRRSPRPGLTVREAAPAEAAGRGTGGGGAAAEAAAPAGGSGARGPSRGRRGLRLQRTGTAGEESTAQARCGHRCQSERGGARAPAVSKATGRRGKDSPNLHLLATAAVGGGGVGGGQREQSLYIVIATRRRNHLINLWWYRGSALTLSPWQLGTAPSFFLSNRVTIPPPCLTKRRRNNHLHLIP